MVVIYLTITVCLVRALAQKLTRQRKGSWATVASEGAIDAFEALGPTFVKLGQLIASSPGIFPAPLSNAALRCLDEVPPFDGATAREMIRKDLGRAPSQIFQHFEESPLSAASIGQVHACVLPDGREAVIKLQRPNIRERMTTDLRIMHRLGSTLQKHTKLGRSANLVGVVRRPPRQHVQGAQPRPRGVPAGPLPRRASPPSATTPTSPRPRCTGTTAART